MDNPVSLALESGDCRVLLSPAGGAILSTTVAGVPLLMPTATPGLATRQHGLEACFPLVPFCGRIAHGFHFEGRHYRLGPNTADPLALHGDGWQREWRVTEAGRSHAELSMAVDASDNSPYAYLATQRIELLPNGLRLSLRVENRGSARLPFGLGFHPYFPVSPASTLHFVAAALWSENALHLPGERQRLAPPFDFRQPVPIPDLWINTCFEGWQGSALIRQPAGHALRLTADPVFGCLMVYRPAGPSPFLCLEPMSQVPNTQGQPDAPGAAILENGDRLSGSIMIELLRP